MLPLGHHRSERGESLTTLMIGLGIGALLILAISQVVLIPLYAIKKVQPLYDIELLKRTIRTSMDCPRTTEALGKNRYCSMGQPVTLLRANGQPLFPGNKFRDFEVRFQFVASQNAGEIDAEYREIGTTPWLKLYQDAAPLGCNTGDHVYAGTPFQLRDGVINLYSQITPNMPTASPGAVPFGDLQTAQYICNKICRPKVVSWSQFDAFNMYDPGAPRAGWDTPSPSKLLARFSGTEPWVYFPSTPGPNTWLGQLECSF